MRFMLKAFKFYVNVPCGHEFWFFLYLFPDHWRCSCHSGHSSRGTWLCPEVTFHLVVPLSEGKGSLGTVFIPVLCNPVCLDSYSGFGRCGQRLLVSVVAEGCSCPLDTTDSGFVWSPHGILQFTLMKPDTLSLFLFGIHSAS